MDEQIPGRTVARARTRLRIRGLVRGAAAGFHVGLWLALALIVIGRGLALPAPWVAAVAGLAVLGATALGGVLGGFRPVPEDRGLALLVDRLANTPELVLTGLHVAGQPDPNRDAILARLAHAELPAMRKLLPLGFPRHLRYSPIPLAIAALALWLVPALNVPWARPESSPTAEEGRRLEDRLKELAAAPAAELPVPLEHEVARLAQDLKGDELSPEEARQRMEELQKKLADYEKGLAPSEDLLKDLEDAAKQLDQASTEKLGEALKNGDFDQAADAAKDLSQSLSQASPEERQRAAEALDQAGKKLSQSADPALQQAGSALKSAGKQVAAGQDPTAGGAGSPTDGGLSAQDAAELAKELEQARSVGQQLQQDQAALQRSQQLSGALEGSRQRLGGDPDVAQGESSGDQPGDGGSPGQDGAGKDGSSSASGDGGAGDGQGDGNGTGGAQGNAGSGVGKDGHTWEDQGNYGGDKSLGSGDRTDGRQDGAMADDFRKLYAAQRLAGAQSLLAGVDGKVDPNGRVDQLPVHLTGGDERATTPALNVPATYQDQAAEAIEAEHVPPAYQQAVKDYFDQMK